MPPKVTQVRKVRAELDGAVLALVDVEETAPYIRLRIEQAIRRANLGRLLGPALEDLERISTDARQAKAQLTAACNRLVE